MHIFRSTFYIINRFFKTFIICIMITSILIIFIIISYKFDIFLRKTKFPIEKLHLQNNTNIKKIRRYSPIKRKGIYENECNVERKRKRIMDSAECEKLKILWKNESMDNVQDFDDIENESVISIDLDLYLNENVEESDIKKETDSVNENEREDLASNSVVEDNENILMNVENNVLNVSKHENNEKSMNKKKHLSSFFGVDKKEFEEINSSNKKITNKTKNKKSHIKEIKIKSNENINDNTHEKSEDNSKSEDTIKVLKVVNDSKFDTLKPKLTMKFIENGECILKNENKQLQKRPTKPQISHNFVKNRVNLFSNELPKNETAQINTVEAVNLMNDRNEEKLVNAVNLEISIPHDTSNDNNKKLDSILLNNNISNLDIDAKNISNQQSENIDNLVDKSEMFERKSKSINDLLETGDIGNSTEFYKKRDIFEKRETLTGNKNNIISKPKASNKIKTLNNNEQILKEELNNLSGLDNNNNIVNSELQKDILNKKGIIDNHQTHDQNLENNHDVTIKEEVLQSTDKIKVKPNILKNNDARLDKYNRSKSNIHTNGGKNKVIITSSEIKNIIKEAIEENDKQIGSVKAKSPQATAMRKNINGNSKSRKSKKGSKNK